MVENILNQYGVMMRNDERIVEVDGQRQLNTTFSSRIQKQDDTGGISYRAKDRIFCAGYIGDLQSSNEPVTFWKVHAKKLSSDSSFWYVKLWIMIGQIGWTNRYL